ncbi:MAG: NUDIX domain-containing protein [Bacteroidales bacterium]|jgi:8-oxo-dGTP pyrophosphatase MutT (NUDIX family)|nr:NUDIX domain-containing protein [Bacteroidales bacterium]
MQKYIIFNKHNKFVIADLLPEDEISEKSIVIECDKREIKMSDMDVLWAKKEAKEDIYLIINGKMTEKFFSHLFPKFAFIKAAGGIVKNENQDTLFIFRNGVWDLPKGHIEAGECSKRAALREVREETGLKNLRIASFADYTYHTYQMNGRWELKQTAWYNMQGSFGDSLTPQTEEGITDLKWIKPDSFLQIIDSTYPSIKAMLYEQLKKSSY